jgi:hypothetical protein
MEMVFVELLFLSFLCSKTKTLKKVTKQLAGAGIVACRPLLIPLWSYQSTGIIMASEASDTAMKLGVVRSAAELDVPARICVTALSLR